jgi:cytochrome c oxidase subunit 4
MEATGEHAKHPPYMLVFGVLFVLTVVEVLFAFTSLPKVWIALGLVAMAIWKAMLVALYYMHLRFEPKRLWLLAVSPLPLAIILVVVVIQEF